jgi:hypothetical protein
MTEMGGMSMPDEPNSIGLAAGESKQLTSGSPSQEKFSSDATFPATTRQG